MSRTCLVRRTNRRQHTRNATRVKPNCDLPAVAVPPENSVLLAAAGLARLLGWGAVGYDAPSRHPNGGDEMSVVVPTVRARQRTVMRSLETPHR